MMEKTDFKTFYEDIEWFLNFLAEEGIKLHPTSPTQTALNELIWMADYHKNGGGEMVENDEIFRSKFRRGIGIASQIWTIKKATPDQKLLVKEKLQIYKKQQVGLLGYEESSTNRNVSWELMAACGSGQFATLNNFSEPDFNVTFNNLEISGACKVLYSDKQEKNANLIIGGIDQIEKHSAGAGFVFANVTNLINHNNFFKEDNNGNFLSFRNPQMAQDFFKNEIWGVHHNMVTNVKDFKERLSFSKSTQTPRSKSLGVIYFAQTLSLVMGVPMILSGSVLFNKPTNTQLQSHIAVEFGRLFHIAAWGFGYRNKTDFDIVNRTETVDFRK